MIPAERPNPPGAPALKRPGWLPDAYWPGTSKPWNTGL